MANYLVEGKLGTGKGKFTVGKMQGALRNGLRVATNVDLFLEHLLPHDSRVPAIRVPDKPTAADLELIGYGCPDEHKYDEDKYGIMVLDELATWLNSRSFGDKDRAAFIDWCVHARKKRWHVYFICQNINLIDKQVRDGLIEYLVKLIRADKMRIPVVGRLLGKMGNLKGLHIANTSLYEMPGFVLERDWFRGKDLHKGYDTLQCFRTWHRNPDEEQFRDEVYMGPYSMLSAWHVAGRHQVAQQARKSGLAALFAGPVRVRPQPKPKSRAMQLIGRLPPDEATRWARRLVMVGGAA